MGEWCHGSQKQRIFEKEWPGLSGKKRIETSIGIRVLWAIGDSGQRHFGGVEGPKIDWRNGR